VLKFIRTRLAQGSPTIDVPNGGGDVHFPERFRGRPALECTDCASGGCPAGRAASPTALIRDGADGRAMLDLGACLFAPEEAVGIAGCGVRFTRDHRMATAARDDLHSSTGEVQLARALDAQSRKLFGRSLRLRSVVAGSCNGCEGELIALGNVVFDLARFGVEFVASPRHADGIVITGVVNRNMRHALEATYAAVPDPRLVIAVGACPASGGPFRGSPEIEGIPASVPVDLWVPGCPPHPLTILDGLLRLLGRLNIVPAGTD
jgi:Ni,Fe-hydrogenase III small subunit